MSIALECKYGCNIYHLSSTCKDKNCSYKIGSYSMESFYGISIIFFILGIISLVKLLSN